MKTNKTFGLAAAAWAAFVCMTAVTASAAPEGDIWYIGPADGGDHGMETLSMADNPLTAGQKVKFKFRLLNRDPQANIEKYAAAHGLPPNQAHASANTWDNRWYFKYVGAGGTNEAASAANLNPPKVGVWVSGRHQWADVESLTLVEGNWDFTDLICSYTAQPGDFGLLTLAAGPESTPVEAAADDTDASHYCLKNRSYWGIYDKQTTTNACNLWLTSLEKSAVATFVTFPSDGDRNADRDMSEARIFIKTVDFDADFKDGIWRQIAAGGTSTAKGGGVPRLSIPFNSPTNESHSVTLYAWTEDETIARMNTDHTETFTNGVERHVMRIDVTPEKGDSIELPDSIAAVLAASNKTTTIYLSATPTNIFRANVLITNFITRTILVGPPDPPSLNIYFPDAEDKSRDNFHKATARATMRLNTAGLRTIWSAGKKAPEWRAARSARPARPLTGNTPGRGCPRRTGIRRRRR